MDGRQLATVDSALAADRVFDGMSDNYLDCLFPGTAAYVEAFFRTAAAQRQMLAFDQRPGRPSHRGKIRRRAYKGRIIRVEFVGWRRRELHATKGWRSYAI